MHPYYPLQFFIRLGFAKSVPLRFWRKAPEEQVLTRKRKSVGGLRTRKDRKQTTLRFDIAAVFRLILALSFLVFRHLVCDKIP